MRVLLAAVLALAVVMSAHPGAVTSAQEDAHPANACSAPYHISGAGWDFCWQQDDPRVQGLELNRVFFQGESVAWKMGVPFTLTQYETPLIGPFKDTLGRPAGGVPGYGLGALALGASECPRFFGDQAQLLHNDRVCVEHLGGPAPKVAIWARFNIYNYRFLQGWILDSGGNIEPVIAMGGLLIDGSNVGANGNNHYHHLYWRIDFDIGATGGDVFQRFQRAVGGLQVGGGNVNAGTCAVMGAPAITAWCGLPLEGQFARDPVTHGKWRVVDPTDTNAQGRAKSYEFVAHSDAAPSHFSTFDTMLVQYKSDNSQIGYEIPTAPLQGDAQLKPYLLPPETVTDPVVWVVQRIYHDTRDEERGSMSPHFTGFKIRPNNFADTNPGESSYPWN